MYPRYSGTYDLRNGFIYASFKEYVLLSKKFPDKEQAASEVLQAPELVCQAIEQYGDLQKYWQERSWLYPTNKADAEELYLRLNAVLYEPDGPFSVAFSSTFESLARDARLKEMHDSQGPSARKALTPFFGVRASGTTPAVDKVVAAAAAEAKRLKMIKNSLSPHAGGYQKPKKHKLRGKSGEGQEGGRSAKDRSREG